MADKEKEDLTPEALEASRVEVTPGKSALEKVKLSSLLEGPEEGAELQRKADDFTAILNETIATGALSEKLSSSWKNLKTAIDHVKTLERVLQPLMEDELKKPEYGGLTYQELLYPEVEDEAEQERRFALIEQAYRNALEKANCPTVINLTTNKSATTYPLAKDKFSGMVVYDMLREVPANGQLSLLPVKMEPKDHPEPITAYYSLSFQDLPPEIKKKLLPFDRLVYGAIGAVQRVNGDYMTVDQIHRAMGNTSKPNKAQTERILNSIIKQARAWITIDCTEERKAYKSDEYDDYMGSLLPSEVRIKGTINGTPASLIHILKPELPLLELARKRHYQILDIPISLLESKLKKEDNIIAMQFYVLERLDKIKNKGDTNKILYKTLFKKTGSTEKKQRQRMKNYLFVFLEELRKKGHIKSYKEEVTKSTKEAGVTFTF